MSKFCSFFITALALAIIEGSFQGASFKSNFDFDYKSENLKISVIRYHGFKEGNYHKISLENKIQTFFGPMTYKLKLTEKDIPCDELPEVLNEDRVDCQPIKNNDWNKNYDFKGLNRTSIDHLKLTEVKFKSEINKKDWEHNLVINFYPMRLTEIEREVDDILKKTNINCLNFSQPHSFEIGHFIHITYNLSQDSFTCRGKLLTAFNLTEELDDLLKLKWIAESINDGFLFSLHGLECYKDTDFLSVNMDFTFIKSLQFPYLVLIQDVETSPISQLYSYKARLFQEELDSESSNSDSYETSIEILSRSILPFLNFELKQKYTNLNASTGYETMMMTNPDLGALAVFANWSERAFNKSVNLYSLSEDPAAPKLHGRGVDPTDTLFHFNYRNLEEEDHTFFSFGLKKDWISHGKGSSSKQSTDKKTFKGDMPRYEL